MKQNRHCSVVIEMSKRNVIDVANRGRRGTMLQNFFVLTDGELVVFNRPLFLSFIYLKNCYFKIAGRYGSLSLINEWDKNALRWFILNWS